MRAKLYKWTETERLGILYSPRIGANKSAKISVLNMKLGVLGYHWYSTNASDIDYDRTTQGISFSKALGLSDIFRYPFRRANWYNDVIMLFKCFCYVQNWVLKQLSNKQRPDVVLYNRLLNWIDCIMEITRKWYTGRHILIGAILVNMEQN